MEIQRILRLENVTMAERLVTVVIEQTIDSDSRDSEYTFVCEGDGLLLTLVKEDLDGIAAEFDERVIAIRAFPEREPNIIGFAEQEISIAFVDGQIYVGRSTAWLGETSVEVALHEARNALGRLEEWAGGLEALTTGGKPRVDTAMNAHPLSSEGYVEHILSVMHERWMEENEEDEE